MPRRVAAIASVALGFALIGTSADGVLALDSELQEATGTTIPTRLTEDRSPAGHDGRCREPKYTAPRSPEV